MLPKNISESLDALVLGKVDIMEQKTLAINGTAASIANTKLLTGVLSLSETNKPKAPSIAVETVRTKAILESQARTHCSSLSS